MVVFDSGMILRSSARRRARRGGGMDAGGRCTGRISLWWIVKAEVYEFRHAVRRHPVTDRTRCLRAGDERWTLQGTPEPARGGTEAVREAHIG